MSSKEGLVNGERNETFLFETFFNKVVKVISVNIGSTTQLSAVEDVSLTDRNMKTANHKSPIEDMS
jgi:hypothetical protein